MRDSEIAKALVEYKRYQQLDIDIEKEMFRGKLTEEEYREFVEILKLEEAGD